MSQNVSLSRETEQVTPKIGRLTGRKTLERPLLSPSAMNCDRLAGPGKRAQIGQPSV